jgi:alpha-L-fucosidase
MPGIAAMARRNQPGLIVVDRAVGGRYENYRTPEQTIPDAPLPYPWETCMTMGDSWSYKPNDKYKSSRELVHKLVDVVAKGGNFLLNVGPDAEGQLPQEAVTRLGEIGGWMRVNSPAIYASRPIAPYLDGRWRFTRTDDGVVHAIYLAEANENKLPQQLTLSGFAPAEGARLQLLGYEGALRWRRGANGATLIEIPDAARRDLAGAYAWTIRIATAGSTRP